MPPYTPMQLAEAFIDAGELDDALDALNQQLTAQPNDEHARRLRAQVLLRTGTAQALEDALSDLTSIQQTPHDHLTRSTLHERRGALQDALAAAQTAQALTSDDRLRARALERVLDLMRKQGQLEQALEIALENDWVQWAADAAVDLNNDRRAVDYYTQALDRIERLFDVTSDNIAANIKARVLLKRGGAHHRMGNYPLAAADYTTAQGIIPDDPMIPFNLGVLAAYQGDEARALSTLRAALAAAPPTLRQHMTNELQDDPRLADLWQQLKPDHDA